MDRVVRSVSHCVRLVTADHGHTARSWQGQHSNIAYERLQLLLQLGAARPDAATPYASLVCVAWLSPALPPQLVRLGPCGWRLLQLRVVDDTGETADGRGSSAAQLDSPLPHLLSPSPSHRFTLSAIFPTFPRSRSSSPLRALSSEPHPRRGATPPAQPSSASAAAALGSFCRSPVALTFSSLRPLHHRPLPRPRCTAARRRRPCAASSAHPRRCPTLPLSPLPSSLPLSPSAFSFLLLFHHSAPFSSPSRPAGCSGHSSAGLPGLCSADGPALSQLLHHSVVCGGGAGVDAPRLSRPSAHLLEHKLPYPALRLPSLGYGVVPAAAVEVALHVRQGGRRA